MPFHTLRKFHIAGTQRPHLQTRARAAFSVAAAALLLAAGAAPGQVVFTKITDTSAGPFASFGTPRSPNSQAPSLSGSVVAFLANGGGGQGIVTAPVGGGGPLVVVTNGLLLPNGLPIGGFLSQPATDGSVVAFVAADVAGRPGVYSAPAAGGGPLAVVADTSTPVPNGSGNFQSFFNAEPSVSGSVVAFTSAPFVGIYTGPATGGPLARVADANTTVQQGGTSQSLSSTVVAFTGNTGNIGGIYTGPAAGGTLTRVADTTTAIPNGSGNFSAFGQPPSLSGSTVAFIGSNSAFQAGVYTGPVGGGVLARIADATTAIPGGSGNFAGFSVVDVYGPTVAFVGTGGGGQAGIYYEDTVGSALTKLLAVGDTLDGKTVSTLYFNDGLEGSNVAFTAAFTDGSQGIYVGHVTSVPEPSSLLLLGATGIGGWVLRRRRRSAADAVGRVVA